MVFNYIEIEKLFSSIINEPWKSNFSKQINDVYFNNKSDFTKFFKNYLDSIINNSENFYSLYNHLYTIDEYGEYTLRNVMENYVSDLFISGERIYFINMAEANKEFYGSNYVFGFTKALISKLIFLDAQHAIEAINYIADNSSLRKDKLYYNVFRVLKKDQFFKINLYYDKLDLHTKYLLLANSLECDFDLAANLSYYITNDKTFHDYVVSLLNDSSIFAISLKKRSVYDLLNLNHIISFIEDQHSKIPLTIEFLIDRAVDRKYPQLLLGFAKFYNKKTIYKCLLKLEDKVYLDKFIKNYGNDKEVRGLLLFK